MASNQAEIRIRIIGSRQATAEILALARANKALKTSVTDLSKGVDHANRRSFLMNQTLFTMRRLVYGASLGIAALGAAALYSGYQFNTLRERTTVALDFLSQGTFSAKEEMKELLKIARETAFLPQGVIEAGQQLIAFGFTAEETNRTLRATGDAIAALNLPQDTVSRITLALGQIRSKGRLMGEELRQLANANVLSFDALEKALGRNVFELGRVADANIPADVAIDAILKSMEARFGGASKRIRETTSGQMEILRGDLQAIFGAIGEDLYNRFGARLRRVTAVTGQMFNQVVEGQGSFTAFIALVDDATGGGLHLAKVFEELGQFGGNFAHVLNVLWGSLQPLIKLLILAAWGLSTVFGWFAWGIDHVPFFSQILTVFIGLLIYEFIVTKLVVLWKKKNAFWTAVTSSYTMKLFKATRLLVLLQLFQVNVLKRLYLAWKAYALAQVTYTSVSWGTTIKGAFIHNSILARMSRTIFTRVIPAIVGMNAAMLLNPWFLAIAAIIILIGVLGYLYWKHEDFRKSVNSMAEDISPVINLMIDFAKVLYAVADAANKAAHGLRDLPFIGRAFMGIGEVAQLGSDAFRGRGRFAGGGLFMPSGEESKKPKLPGLEDVGEASAGFNWESVLAQMSGAGGQAPIQIEPAPVMLDGRVLTEVVFNHRNDRAARR